MQGPETREDEGSGGPLKQRKALFSCQCFVYSSSSAKDGVSLPSLVFTTLATLKWDATGSLRSCFVKLNEAQASAGRFRNANVRSLGL